MVVHNKPATARMESLDLAEQDVLYGTGAFVIGPGFRNAVIRIAKDCADVTRHRHCSREPCTARFAGQNDFAVKARRHRQDAERFQERDRSMTVRSSEMIAETVV